MSQMAFWAAVALTIVCFIATFKGGGGSGGSDRDSFDG
jgi:hypothetical protein